jgi:hypothetical protein
VIDAEEVTQGAGTRAAESGLEFDEEEEESREERVKEGTATSPVREVNAQSEPVVLGLAIITPTAGETDRQIFRAPDKADPISRDCWSAAGAAIRSAESEVKERFEEEENAAGITVSL